MAKKTTKNAPEVKSLEQLLDDLAKLRADYIEAQKSHRQGELVNPRVLTAKRREIARTLTAINTAKLSQKEEN